jgi:DNA-3-methyladenine glycosylase
MQALHKLDHSFYQRDVLDVAPGLIGKYLVRKFRNGELFRSRITEVEAYRGEEDLACHASKGRTTRNEIMYHSGGVIYVYLIYGMYWMLNFVTGFENVPQAVLIRSLEHISGPGRITKRLEIDGSFYGISLIDSGIMWLENHHEKSGFTTAMRIGVDYAGEIWKNKQWRFIMESPPF